jgi:hypothetical protein
LTKTWKARLERQVTTGVQEYFDRFIVMEDGTWTRHAIKAEHPNCHDSISSRNAAVAAAATIISDEEDVDDNPNDDREEDKEMADTTPEETEQESCEETQQRRGNELAGQWSMPCRCHCCLNVLLKLRAGGD